MKTNTSHNTKRITLAAVAALCLSSAAIGAYADETGKDAPTVAVRYSDLNLGTQAGAKTLYSRIRYAAEEVCGNPDWHERFESAAVKACTDRAISTSVHSVNNARLTSVYDSDRGVKPISVAVLR
jgi:UrcA family protein